LSNKNIDHNFFNFKQKNVYVLGGSGLIGKYIVKNLLKSGARVICLDIVNNFKNQKNNFHYVKFDISTTLTDNYEVESLFVKFGKPHAFINCSYPKVLNNVDGSFLDNTFSNLKDNVLIHLLSYSNISMLVANFMHKYKIKGKILLFSSLYGFQGQDLNLYINTKMNENMNYSIIKGGITNLVRQMAGYYGQFGININCISPGGVLENSNSKRPQNKKFLKKYCLKTPLGRLANPEEISYSSIFLISNHADYITGSNYIIDGGISLV